MIDQNERRAMLGIVWTAHRSIGFDHKNLHQSLRFATRHLPVFQQQLQELDAVISIINLTSNFPKDMENTIKLKKLLNEKGVDLPLILNDQTRGIRAANEKMLQRGDQLLGTYFHFDTEVKSAGKRMACAVMDGYGLLVPYLLKKGRQLKTTQGIAVNAICEVAAVLQAESTRPTRLFTAAFKGNWYNPRFGFSNQFLKSHNLIKSSK